MKILAIETSCDDTGVALLESKGKKIKVLADTIVSQTKIHEQYGGVFPMKAKIAHVQNLVPALLAVPVSFFIYLLVAILCWHKYISSII